MDVANRIVLNIGGIRFETYKNVLKKIPATRLSRINERLVNYDPILNEYFFDRHPGSFQTILNYYRTGKLHYPNNVCGPLFEAELEFWGLDSNQVEPCCWKTYTNHRATEETLATLDRLKIDVKKSTKQELESKFGFEKYRCGNMPYFKRVQPVVWQLFEEPRSSITATIIAGIQISMIILSVVVLWLSAYPFSQYHEVKMTSESLKNFTSFQYSEFRIQNVYTYHLLIAIEYITVTWFLIDNFIRFIVSPEKNNFFRDFNNCIDIIASLSTILNFICQTFPKSLATIYSDLLHSIQVVRVFRLMRLFKYHAGQRVIILSIMTSSSILGLLVLFMLAASILFGSFIFYSERIFSHDPDSNLFSSFFEAFWFCIVSLTTIGYGDFVPVTLLGKLFGSACVLIGYIIVNMPISIIVEILTNFYNHLGARSKFPKERRKVIETQKAIKRKMTIVHNIKN